MTAAYVVDASTAVKLYLVEPLATEAAAVFDLLTGSPPATLHVPDLFYAECANIFWKQAQRGNCSPTQTQGFLTSLRALPLVGTASFELVEEALPLALVHGITAYDACYAALAVRLGVALVTADQKLETKLAGTPVQVTWIGRWTPPAVQQAPGP